MANREIELAFWYIIMLFQFYLLYPLFRSAILGVKERWGWQTHYDIDLIRTIVRGFDRND